MPKKRIHLALNLNLLKPQSNPEKIFVKIIRWLLSSGRYIFVFVEAIVLIAFLARFKLDADLAAKKEAIEEQIPYIESLRPYEILIRNTQEKLSIIDKSKNNSGDFPEIFQKIAAAVPSSVKVSSIKMQNASGTTAVRITGETPLNNDVANFINGLKEDPSFSNIAVASLGLEEELIKFTIDASARIATLVKNQ